MRCCGEGSGFGSHCRWERGIRSGEAGVLVIVGMEGAGSVKSYVVGKEEPGRWEGRVGDL